jgi:hypothetical protein
MIRDVVIVQVWFELVYRIALLAVKGTADEKFPAHIQRPARALTDGSHPYLV